MPVNYKKDYPPNWKELATSIKEAAGWKCEWCEAPHKAVIQRKEDGTWVEVLLLWNPVTLSHDNTSKVTWARLAFNGLTRIILTTAHLDRNHKNNDPLNLAALCQRCHLRHDILQHVANRKYGRHHNREHQLKLDL